MDEREYTIFEHLTELRSRLLRALGAIVIAGLALFAIASQLVRLLKLPAENAAAKLQIETLSFVQLAPAEYFIAKLKVAFVGGIFLTAPWWLYQVWLFVAPGLYKNEKKWIGWFVGSGAIFFVAGGLFAYFLVFPNAFYFFFNDAADAGLAQTLSIAEYISFSLKLLLAFGVIFQVPIVVVIVCASGLVTPDTLVSYRPHIIVAGFIVGAVLTPPDPTTQTMLAVPLWILFEAGVIASRAILKVAPVKPPGEEDLLDDSNEGVSESHSEH